MLPSKFRMKYRCTIYYTPKESGFTAARGFNVKGTTAPGIAGGVQFPKAFLAAVIQEGVGKVTNEHVQNGMKFIAYDTETNLFKYISIPVGLGDKPLVDRVSCAIRQAKPVTSTATIPPTARLMTQAPNIQQAFGGSNFVVADVGMGVHFDAIDLYWGVDDPRAGNYGSPASTSFQENDGTPIVLTSY